MRPDGRTSRACFTPRAWVSVEPCRPPACVTGATRFALELDGNARRACPTSAQGGDAVGEVVVDPAGPDGIQRKHLGAVHYTDIVLTCGIGMEPAFWTWLSDTLEGKNEPRDGALRVLDFDGKERERVEFTNGLVTEIGFPALDGASKDALRAHRPHRRRSRSGGSAAAARPPPAASRASRRSCRTSACRSTGLDLKRASRVGPLTIRRDPTGAWEVPTSS